MLTGPLCCAARVLVEWPSHHLAQKVGISPEVLESFEQKRSELDDDVKHRLQLVLEEGGAVFIPENGGGLGVRLKFSQKEVKAINKWEGEGGPVGSDDV